MIIIPKDCADGTCEHAEFPHMLVTTAEYSTHIKGVWHDIPSIEFIVCLACHHWPEGLKDGRCRCDCHVIVVDSTREAGAESAASRQE